MAHKEYKRIDETAMLLVLSHNRGYIAEIILRLAWNLGLYREEMYNLKWSDISVAEKTVHLPDRSVPMDDDVADCLERRAKSYHGRKCEYVVSSDKRYTHMALQSISRAARTALERGGLDGITLVDLRHDFIIRQLEKNDWPYVARISGDTIGTLYTNYGEYCKKAPDFKPQREVETKVDEYKLWKIIESERTSPEGLGLWMTWKLGMRVRDILALTWDQVDLVKGEITLDDRKISLSSEFVKRLQEVKATRNETSDPHVLLTPQSQKPFDYARYSRFVRTVLIRGGMEDTLLKDLYLDENKLNEDEIILRHAAKKGSVTKKDVIRLLNLTETSAYNRLERLIKAGELVRVGQKCFLPGTIVPPEEQYEVLRAHLETVGIAFRQEIADLLHLEGRQCGTILRKLVAEGKLVKKGQLYSLPNTEKT